MKKSILLIAIIAVAIITISGCSLNKSFSQNKEIIKIGAILPLTGKVALIGEQIKNGITLAVEDINAKGGQQIEVLYEDSKLDPKEGVTATNKLMEINGVKYLEVAGTPVITAIQTITEKNKVLMTAASVSANVLKDTNYTLRTFYNPTQATEKLAEFIKNNNYSKVALIYTDGDAYKSQIDLLEKNGVVFSHKEKYTLEEKDFKTILLKTKSSNADLVVLLGYGPTYPALFKQMAELKMENLNILGDFSFLEVPQDSLELYKNVKFIMPDFNLAQTDTAKEFSQRYEKRFGTKPNHQVAYAYDTINLLYLGITKTDGSTDNVMNYLKNYGEYNGVVGKTELKNSDMSGGLSFGQYKNGVLMPLNSN
ncbi:MAG: ABC transporter substrate-binding protein [Candidatus Buchananbacteria bacterium]